MGMRKTVLDCLVKGRKLSRQEADTLSFPTRSEMRAAYIACGKELAGAAKNELGEFAKVIAASASLEEAIANITKAAERMAYYEKTIRFISEWAGSLRKSSSSSMIQGNYLRDVDWLIEYRRYGSVSRKPEWAAMVVPHLPGKTRMAMNNVVTLRTA